MNDDPPVLPPDAPEAAHLNKVFTFARDLRGAFIDQAIWIDVILTEILALYFVPSDSARRMLLSSDVLTGRDATFSGRIATLKKVVDRSFADFAGINPDLFDRLDKIRRFRNRLAHAHLDTSERFLAKGHTDRVQFAFYEGGEQKMQVVTSEDVKARLAECTHVVLKLLELRKLVEAPA